MSSVLAKVDRSGGADACWPWMGEVNQKGYGRAWQQGRRTAAHRVAYELLVGPVPDGLVLDHLCRNRACCNPAHLEPVTNRENILRGIGLAAQSARKTHCKLGHPLDGVRHNGHQGRKTRYCRVCVNAARAEYRRKFGV